MGINGTIAFGSQYKTANVTNLCDVELYSYQTVPKQEVGFPFATSVSQFSTTSFAAANTTNLNYGTASLASPTATGTVSGSVQVLSTLNENTLRYTVVDLDKLYKDLPSALQVNMSGFKTEYATTDVSQLYSILYGISPGVNGAVKLYLSLKEFTTRYKAANVTTLHYSSLTELQNRTTQIATGLSSDVVAVLCCGNNADSSVVSGILSKRPVSGSEPNAQYIPQIAWGATGADFSDTRLYPAFLRTGNGQTEMLKAFLGICGAMKWNEFGTVTYEANLQLELQEMLVKLVSQSAGNFTISGSVRIGKTKETVQPQLAHMKALGVVY